MHRKLNVCKSKKCGYEISENELQGCVEIKICTVRMCELGRCVSSEDTAQDLFLSEGFRMRRIVWN